MGKNRDTLSLGIDLGGTKILTAVANTTGKMLSHDHSLTLAKEGQEAVVRSILEYAGLKISVRGKRIEESISTFQKFVDRTYLDNLLKGSAWGGSAWLYEG
jgi:N-acetylglucosamine kinase-like BadF-type ATPase